MLSPFEGIVAERLKVLGRQHVLSPDEAVELRALVRLVVRSASPQTRDRLVRLARGVSHG